MESVKKEKKNAFVNTFYDQPIYWKQLVVTSQRTYFTLAFNPSAILNFTLMTVVLEKVITLLFIVRFYIMCIRRIHANTSACQVARLMTGRIFKCFIKKATALSKVSLIILILNKSTSTVSHCLHLLLVCACGGRIRVRGSNKPSWRNVNVDRDED